MATTLVIDHISIRNDEQPEVWGNKEEKPLIQMETVSHLHGVINMDFFFHRSVLAQAFRRSVQTHSNE